MKCVQAMEGISDYIDGNLKGKEWTALESHLEACHQCRELLADFQKIVEEAQDLESLEPPDSAWSAIRRDLETRRHTAWKKSLQRKRLFGFPLLKPITVFGAALLILIVVGGLTIGPLFRNAGSGDLTVNGGLALTKLAEAETHYQLAIKALNDAMSASAKDMDPEILKVFRDNLQLVNFSLEECRLAVSRNPGDIETRYYMLAVYKQKTDLLSSMISFGTESASRKKAESIL
ncbi:MAG: hypothetical protein MUP70_14925 [Candidatus Aminicenantes bacterium]|nr:hypothetical protein [Candidatus Aminicenantes bacterium]